ncbi:MAG: GrpB family protein [Elusimicrobia bacterium]|nr:GrpB family protein [Elusimicrobiota bacterium]
MDDLIEVVPYEASWPAAYEAERAAINARLGELGASFEHIGSTAVPGIAAKPTIDLMAGVDELRVDESVVEPLADLGYRYLGEYGIAGRHFFRKGSPPTHHLHWVRRGGDFWWKQLVFRDFLRTSPTDARAYEALKRDLASRFHNDRSRYTASKTSFVTGTLERAWRWSKAPLVVFDLEATCWEKGTVVERQELIEIGAVRLEADFAVRGEFQRFVRPTGEPALSDFCRRLTGIRQEDLDAAESFLPVLASFVDWAGPGPLRFASWSTYDLRQLRSDCRRHLAALPPPLECHLDLRQRFSEQRGLEPQTMKRALELAGLAQEGHHHRGLDDARNIARLATLILKS